MTEFEPVLRLHAQRYPGMRPADALKLAYQGEFGCEHMLSCPKSALARLKSEYENIPQLPSAPLFEDIGGGFARVNIAALDAAAVAPEALFRWFSASAAIKSGTAQGFAAKLGALRELALSGALPFGAQEFALYLQGYDLKTHPPVSHSPHYRALYRPAYRVVIKELCLL